MPPARGLRAERDYIVGSGVSGRWTIAGGDGNTKIRFDALARRAASLLPDADDEDALVRRHGKIWRGWTAILNCRNVVQAGRGFAYNTTP